MKKLNVVLLTILTIFTSQALAGSGKAVLPHWGGQTGKPGYIFLSNITDDAVKVTITFYGKNGATLTPSTFTNFSNGNTELAARSSGYVSLSPGVWDYGFATIEWEDLEQNDNTVALVAHGFRVVQSTSSTRSDYAIQINNGMPF